MKQLLFLAVLFISFGACGQNPPASPPAKASETTDKGATITISYSQPSVKGRTIGKDLEPMEGKVWRTGANKATVFEVNKDVKVEGQTLPAGKYSLFTLVNGDEWTIIFNKTWDQWGAFNYKEADDALRVKVKGKKADPVSEKMTFVVNKNGTVSLMWGDRQADFAVL
ncbi:MAG TPA: DUF2911 domain-containing protein [Chitinophagaceae bacterium]|nr:DUF2911 domain-containing protein [Chitinophagaceae bacterium]